jgi:hypothetical protein
MTFDSKRGLVATALLAAAMSFYFYGLLIPQVRVGMRQQNRAGGYYCGNDLYPIWLTTGDMLASRTNPYSMTTEHRIETGLYGRPLDRSNRSDRAINYRGFSYPLYTDVLAIPLSFLSFRSVQIFLSILFPILIVRSVSWWCAGVSLSLSRVAFTNAALLTLFSIPVLEGWWALQPTIIVGVLLAATLAALRRNALGLAGIALALGSIKPQLILLPALWLTVWAFSDWPRRRRLIFALAVTTIVLLALSEIWLPKWWLSWWHQLPAYRQFDSPPLVELSFGKLIGRALGLAALCLGLAAATRWRRLPADSSRFSLLFAFLLAAGVVFISSSIAVYDQFLLAPGLLVLWRDRQTVLSNRMMRFATFALSLAFFWPWVAAPTVSVIHMISPAVVSDKVILLPLLTAASFPLLLLSVLSIVVLKTMRDTPADSTAIVSG